MDRAAWWDKQGPKELDLIKFTHTHTMIQYSRVESSTRDTNLWMSRKALREVGEDEEAPQRSLRGSSQYTQ